MRKFVSQKETAALLCPLGFLLHPDGCDDHDDDDDHHDDHDDQVGDDDDDQDDCDVVDHNDHDMVNAMMLTKALMITST